MKTRGTIRVRSCSERGSQRQRTRAWWVQTRREMRNASCRASRITSPAREKRDTTRSGLEVFFLIKCHSPHAPSNPLLSLVSRFFIFERFRLERMDNEVLFNAPARFLRMQRPNGMSSQNKRLSTFGAKRPGDTWAYSRKRDLK